MDNVTILQAIQAFALMKQELNQLRNQQAVQDGDPPAILQQLASPDSTKATSRMQSPIAASTPNRRLDPHISEPSPLSFPGSPEQGTTTMRKHLSSPSSESQYGTPLEHAEEEDHAPPSPAKLDRAALALARSMLDEKDARIQALEQELQQHRKGGKENSLRLRERITKGLDEQHNDTIEF